jgi:DNA polymerase-3 subunit epsilon
VIHNADFDVGFLDHELALMKHKKPSIRSHASIRDTLTMAREMHPGQRNSLDALCKRYDVDASSRNVHGALIDAELLARVYLAMTGGQTALLLDEEDDSKDKDAQADIKIEVRSDLHLRVVKATEAEDAAHQAMLAKLRENAECLWDRLPEG